MNSLKTRSVILGLSLVAVGCSTMPDEGAMKQLDGEELHDLVIGNTTTTPEHYGRWAEYHATEQTSYARAWGTWGRQDVESTHVTDPDGTMCHKYTGPYDWAGPYHEYCGVIYEDAEGNYYYKVLKNTNNPNRVGNLMEMEIKPGDPYGLAE